MKMETGIISNSGISKSQVLKHMKSSIINKVVIIHISALSQQQNSIELFADDDTINVVCPATTDGNVVFIPYPYDCNLYYVCEGFKPTLMSCPGQLEFDATLNVCNWAFAAGCVATPRPTQPEMTTEDGFQATTEEMGITNREFEELGMTRFIKLLL